MLCISENDIERATSFEDLTAVIEESFSIYEENDFQMPDRMHVHSGSNTLLLMPCFTSRFFSTKLVSVFPGNAKQGRPVIYGTVVLNDGETGEPLALLNGAKITALRTAAVGSVGLKYLSEKSTSRLGIIGAGVQGLYQALFAARQRSLTDIYVFSRTERSAVWLKEKLKSKLPNIEVTVKKRCEDLLADSEAVITTTTSETPVIPDKPELLEGKCFIGIGSFKPNVCEYPPSFFPLLDQVFIDTDFATKETGDLVMPLEKSLIMKSQVFTLGKLRNKKIQLTDNKTRFFKSVGMALFDLVAAIHIYKSATKKGLGVKVTL